VLRPTIRIEEIAVKDDRATVKVTTTAEGQARVMDTIQLRQTADGWRIESLSD
jgi:hypothetical protein